MLERQKSALYQQEMLLESAKITLYQQDMLLERHKSALYQQDMLLEKAKMTLHQLLLTSVSAWSFIRKWWQPSIMKPFHIALFLLLLLLYYIITNVFFLHEFSDDGFV